ncbi:MAG: peptide ABC transporter substrate-binding protein, partial [Verrucomicrobiota bacterium]
MTFSWRSVIAAGLTLLLAACDSSHQRADLVYNNAYEPETVDPALTTGQPGIRMASSLFEGLTRFDKDGQTEPGMAEHWDVSPDGLTYTFHLRKTAAWSNGESFVAEDFVKSWRRTLQPETGSKYVSQLFYIKNARAFSEGTLTDPAEVGFRAIGAHVLEVELENPTPFFVDLCAFVTLSPIHLPSVEKYGDLWTRPANLVCNGPYRIAEWRLNHRIRLEKNAHYWDRENVALETIDVLPISDPNSSFNFFYSGLVDLATDKALVPTSLIGALRDKPYFHSGNFLATYFIRFNVTRKPFDDPRIRQAFALAIDKDRI